MFANDVSKGLESLAIYLQRNFLSVQEYSVNSLISNSVLIKADIFTGKTAATSSNHGTETNLLGITLTAIINVQCPMYVSVFINQFKVTAFSIA